jgi:hypothetical protein
MHRASELAAQSVADSLRPLVRSRKARLTLGELVTGVVGKGDGGLGPVLFVLILPVLLPLPPGFSMVLALPLLVVAPQIIAGRQQLWLPKTLARWSLKRTTLVKQLERILPLLERFESVARPRLTFLTGAIGVRLVGVACTLVAVILILPIPFANLLPSLAMGAFSLGLTRKDGLLVLAGYGLLAAAAVLIALEVHGLAIAVRYVRSIF